MCTSDSKRSGRWSEPSLVRHVYNTLGKYAIQSLLTRNQSNLTQFGSNCPFIQENLLPKVGGSTTLSSVMRFCTLWISTRLGMPLILFWRAKIALKSPQITQGRGITPLLTLIFSQKIFFRERAFGPYYTILLIWLRLYTF